MPGEVVAEYWSPRMARQWKSIFVSMVITLPVMGLLHAIPPHSKYWNWTTELYAVLIGVPCYALVFWLFVLYRRNCRIIVGPKRIVQYRGSTTPSRIINMSEVDDLKAEHSQYEFTRLIYLKNGDVITYGGEIENVFDLDEALMRYTGLQFRRFQTGQPIDLKAETEAIKARVQARAKQKGAKRIANR